MKGRNGVRSRDGEGISRSCDVVTFEKKARAIFWGVTR